MVFWIGLIIFLFICLIPLAFYLEKSLQKTSRKSRDVDLLKIRLKFGMKIQDEYDYLTYQIWGVSAKEANERLVKVK